MSQFEDAAYADGASDYDEIEQALRVYTPPAIAVAPDDRTGGALPSRRGKLIRRSLLLLAVAGAGAAVYQAPDYWLARWSDATALATTAWDRIKPQNNPQVQPPTQTQPAQDVAAATPPSQAEQPAAPPPPVVEMSAEKPITEAALPPAATPADQPSEKPARAEPLDPLRKRAEAAGLHPDLSLAVLKQLSDADFANARAAIKTAVAETSETQDYIWPSGKAAKPGLAVFTITFVQGADAGCRRYVVTIAKKGWLTTAPAMEKCSNPSGKG